MKKKKRLCLFQALSWAALGVGFLYISYSEYQAWRFTGFVTALKGGFRFSGPGAIWLLIGYIGLSMTCLVASYLYWRKRDECKNVQKTK